MLGDIATFLIVQAGVRMLVPRVLFISFICQVFLTPSGSFPDTHIHIYI
jgi:hypothetical protein